MLASPGSSASRGGASQSLTPVNSGANSAAGPRSLRSQTVPRSA